MKVLFICTHNRCRSIMAEAIARQQGGGALEARSAGSAPEEHVNQRALLYLREHGYKTGGLSSQSWDEFDSFRPDLIVTLCDQAAGESCPTWFGQAEQEHWGMTDPSKLEGSENEIADAFASAIEDLERKIEALLRASAL
jgi:arsenate reductase